MASNNTKKGGATRIVARIFLLIEVAAFTAMCLMLSRVLPMKYLGILIGVCVLISALQLILVAGRGSGRNIASIVLSILFCAAAALAIYFMGSVHTTLDKISSSSRKEVATIQTMNIYVRKADDLMVVSDLEGRSIGILQTQDRINTDLALEQIKALCGGSLRTAEFQGILPLINGLANYDADAILINSAFAGAITENDPSFLEWAELLGTVDVTRNPDEAAEEAGVSENIRTSRAVPNVSRDPFLIYLTGMDTRTDEIVADLGNSDVNMVIAVNPSTHRILMVNIPRDYYWYLWGDESYPDKITHAGCFGVDCSIQTIDSLFGINTNYFVKVGFNSVINIVDAIGGITVNSPYDFTIDGVEIHAGENYLDGNGALQFARERYQLPGGDRARGMNQQEVIRAIISKVSSPSMLPRYSDIISIIAANTMTSLSADDMEKLFKNTLEKGAWDVQSIQVDGAGGWEYCYALGDANDVMIPDWSTVESAKEKITEVIRGQ